MSWNQDLRCTSQEANPSPIHLFKILLPKFIHRVVFHYITQIIISDFKDFRMKYLEDKSLILLLFMQFNPSFKSKSINKDCSRSAPNPKNSSLLWRSLLPATFFICCCNSDSKKPLFHILLKDMNEIDECCEVLKFLVI